MRTDGDSLNGGLPAVPPFIPGIRICEFFKNTVGLFKLSIGRAGDGSFIFYKYLPNQSFPLCWGA